MSVNDPPVASYARQRLEEAWARWEAFTPVPAIVVLEARIENSEAWFRDHGPDDPEYAVARRVQGDLKKRLTLAYRNPIEVERLHQWRALEEAYREAERDYGSVAGSYAFQRMVANAGGTGLYG